MALKNEAIADADYEILLPDEWIEICGKTEKLSAIYDEIYKDAVRSCVCGYHACTDRSGQRLLHARIKNLLKVCYESFDIAVITYEVLRVK